MYNLKALFVAFLAHKHKEVNDEIESLGHDIVKDDVISYLKQIRTNETLLRASLKATIAQNKEGIHDLRTIVKFLENRIPNFNANDCIALLE